jgi:hypothetical protein
MPALKIYRETALPGTLEPSAIYLIAPPGSPQYVEMYVSNATASAAKRILKESDVQAMISSAMSAVNELTVVADIAARNALAPTRTMYVFVRNATADVTVASGGATYLYDLANTVWVKVSEAEGLDVTFNWASLAGRPTASTAAIDATVLAAHTHANKTQLDKVGQDGAGNFTYDGALPSTAWTSAGW